MGWLIALAVLVALAVLPIGVRVCYDREGFFLWLLAGPLRWQLLPGKKKEKAKENKKKASKTEKKAPSKPEEKQEGGSIRDFFPLVWRVLDFLGDLRRKLRVNRLEARVTLAGGDPCDLALNYGKAVTAMSALDPQLERLFVIKKKNIRIECDFVRDEPVIWARADLTVTVARILSMGVRHGLRILREYLNIMKMRKGGAVK